MNNKSDRKPTSTAVKPIQTTNRPIGRVDSDYLSHGLNPNPPAYDPNPKPNPGPKKK